MAQPVGVQSTNSAMGRCQQMGFTGSKDKELRSSGRSSKTSAESVRRCDNHQQCQAEADSKRLRSAPLSACFKRMERKTPSGATKAALQTVPRIVAVSFTMREHGCAKQCVSNSLANARCLEMGQATVIERMLI